MEEKADEQKVQRDQQTAETMLAACLCQCNLVPRLAELDMVPNAMAMGFEDLATCHQEGWNLVV